MHYSRHLLTVLVACVTMLTYASTVDQWVRPACPLVNSSKTKNMTLQLHHSTCLYGCAPSCVLCLLAWVFFLLASVLSATSSVAYFLAFVALDGDHALLVLTCRAAEHNGLTAAPPHGVFVSSERQRNAAVPVDCITWRVPGLDFIHLDTQVTQGRWSL